MPEPDGAARGACPELQARQSVDRHRVRVDPATSQSASRAALGRAALHTRAQSPGRSARRIGPQMANVIVRGSVSDIDG